MNLEKNLKILQQKNPKLHASLESCTEPKWFELIYSENKMVNFLVKRGGMILPAYDIKNPNKNNDISKKNLIKSNVTILLGLGLGHNLKEILSKKDKEHRILVIEPNVFLVKKTLEIYDFSEYFLNNTLIILSTNNKEDIAGLFSYFEESMVVRCWALIAEKYIFLRNEEYAEIGAFLMQLINQFQCNIGTMEGAGYRIAMNDIANLPYIIKHRGVDELKDIFKDKPCVLVSTGPSLQKNIHFIKENKDNVVVIAVAQALRVLMAYDIVPDFICTVDYGEVNEEHFKHLWDVNVPLVALNRSYDQILKKWQGTKFIAVSKTFGYKDTVVGKLQENGSLEQGGSVSHFAFGLALKMGCNPIIITGQDLSYEGDKSHIPLVDAGGSIKIEKDGNINWKIDDPRSTLIKNKKNKGNYAMGAAIPIEGYYGDTVYTNVGLASFKTAFETLFRAYPDRKYINSTEGGAKLKGTEQMLLKNAFKKFCTKKISKAKLEQLTKYEKKGWKTSIKQIIPILKKDIEILENVVKNSKKGLNASKEIQEENKKKKRNLKKIDKLLLDNEKYSNIAHEFAKKNPLIGIYIYKESRKLYSSEFDVKNKSLEKISKDKSSLKIRIKRNSMILKAALKGGNALIDIYKKSLNILEEYDKTKNEDLLSDKTPVIVDLTDVEKYYKVGNWGHPYVDAKRILNNKNNYSKEEIEQARKIYLRSINEREKVISKANKIEDRTKLIEYNDFMEKAYDAGKKQNNFQLALGYLEQAHEIFPDDQQALWGLATTYHFMEENEKSIEYYKKLVEKCPDNKKYRFEYGNVLLTKNILMGLDEIKKVMIDTDEFDTFLLYMGQLYFGKEMYKEASIALQEYIIKFPYSVEALECLEQCYDKLGNQKEKEFIKQKKEKLQGK